MTRSIDKRIVAVARAAVVLYDAIDDLVQIGDQLVEIDGYLMAPVRRHIDRAIEPLDQLLYELEQFGRGYPDPAREEDLVVTRAA